MSRAGNTQSFRSPWQTKALAAPPFLHAKVSINSLHPSSHPSTRIPPRATALCPPFQPTPSHTIAPHITLVGEPPAENGLQRHPLDGHLGEQRRKCSNQVWWGGGRSEFSQGPDPTPPCVTLLPPLTLPPSAWYSVSSMSSSRASPKSVILTWLGLLTSTFRAARSLCTSRTSSK